MYTGRGFGGFGARSDLLKNEIQLKTLITTTTTTTNDNNNNNNNNNTNSDNNRNNSNHNNDDYINDDKCTTTTQRGWCIEAFVSILAHLQSQKLFPEGCGV